MAWVHRDPLRKTAGRAEMNVVSSHIAGYRVSAGTKAARLDSTLAPDLAQVIRISWARPAVARPG